METISIYGYNTKMLGAVEAIHDNRIIAPQHEGSSIDSNAVPSAPKIRSRCHLLALPVEILRCILHHLLPRSIDTTCEGHNVTTWERGNITILGTNKQLYTEGIRILYGSNRFIIDVVWDCSTFAYSYFSFALVAKRTMAFPDHLAPRNVALIRRLCIHVHHVDSYLGMMKYNYSGPGLADGLQMQLRFLCQTLRGLEQIKELRVDLRDDTKSKGTDELVLGPLLALRNTCEVSLSGDCSPEFSDKVQSCLADAYWNYSKEAGSTGQRWIIS